MKRTHKLLALIFIFYTNATVELFANGVAAPENNEVCHLDYLEFITKHHGCDLFAKQDVNSDGIHDEDCLDEGNDRILDVIESGNTIVSALDTVGDLLRVNLKSQENYRTGNDTDNDDVLDIDDLDDDNDGILDEDEAYCGESPQTIAGSGALVNDLYFFDWNNLSITTNDMTGATVYTSQFVHKGITYKAEIQNVNRIGNIPVTAADMGAGYAPSYAIPVYNPNGNTEVIKAAFPPGSTNTVTYDIKFTAEKNGMSFPVKIAVFDAQVTNHDFGGWKESLSFATTGTNFSLLEEIGGDPNSADAITGENTQLLTYLCSRPEDNSLSPRNAMFCTKGTNLRITTEAKVIAYGSGPVSQAMAYAVVLHCDTDSDGIPDYLDLDSDDDGCPDAIEGGDKVLSANLNADGSIDVGDTAPFDINANGVPNIVSDGGSIDIDEQVGQSVGYSQNSQINYCSGDDTDSDGVLDIDDLDDDNDGILDADEQYCGESTQTIAGSGALVNDLYFFDWGGLNINTNSTGTTVYTTQFVHKGMTYTAEIENVNRTANIPITAADMGAGFAPSYAVPVYNPNGNTEVIKATFPAVPATVTYDIKFTAEKNGMSFPVKIAVFDAQVTNHDFSGWKESLSFTTTGTGFSLLEEIGGNPNSAGAITGENTQELTYLCSRPDDNSLSPRNAMFCTKGTNLRITTEAKIITVGGPIASQAMAYAVVLNCDTDSDGIPNYLDLDSDNDGCPDAKEGTKNLDATNDASGTALTDGNGNQVTTNLPTPVGTSATDNGVPTVAIDATTVGQGVGSSTDSGVNTCAVLAHHDINQTPEGVAVDGNVLINDEDATTIASAQYYNASGVLTALIPNTATPVYAQDAASNWVLAGTITADGTDGAYTFVPAANFTGDVLIEYTAENTAGNQDDATLTIKVIPTPNGGNNAPIAQNDTYTVEEGQTASLNVLHNDSDPDGDDITVTGVELQDGLVTSNGGTGTTVTPGTPTDVYDGTTKLGTLTVNTDGTTTFVPEADFTGEVPFEYTIADSDSEEDTAVATITVLPASGNNDVFGNDDANTGKKSEMLTGNINDNDLDPEGNPFTVTLIDTDGDGVPDTAPGVNMSITQDVGGVPQEVGKLTIAPDGSYTWSPVADFVGTVVLPYEITDQPGTGVAAAKDVATLYLTSLPLTDCGFLRSNRNVTRQLIK